MNKNTKEKKFDFKEVTENDINHENKFDLASLYEQTHKELTLQQSKRDQIITLYLSIFSLLIPLAFSIEGFSNLNKGLIFIAVGVIGVIFSVITVRYRIYKEVYWLCCETITCMMNIKNEKLNKDTVQSLYYRSLAKKGNNFCNHGKWSSYLYCKKNLFSSETLHYLIITLLTSVLFALGIFLILPLNLDIALTISIVSGFVLMILLMISYFHNCIALYAVLKDGLDKSFNKTFSKAWFLHIYIDDYKNVNINQ
ncbi:MAG: hypothetical protein K2L67_00700 [Clostridia bacterium]|nr:hypothetical protein [Clostridia bacterium]